MENYTIIGKEKLQKLAVAVMACLVFSGSLCAQQVYDNFEGKKVLSYGERIGVLDTLAKNPAPDKVNGSEKCALYVRNGSKKFANIKMILPQKLTNIEAYATYLGEPPKFKLKVYTSAPAGTLVEILLGSRKGNNDYPAGTHSQFQAYTTTSNAWEELEFKFSQIPQGSETSPSQVDQIVLLFNPNSSNSDTYYFDDLTGPMLAPPTSKADEPVVTPNQSGTKSQEVKKQGEKDKTITTKKGNEKKDAKK